MLGTYTYIATTTTLTLTYLLLLLSLLHINEFVQNVTNLLRDPNDQFGYNGVFAGYIDDLSWAATFDKMVEVIKFALERGADAAV